MQTDSFFSDCSPIHTASFTRKLPKNTSMFVRRKGARAVFRYTTLPIAELITP